MPHNGVGGDEEIQLLRLVLARLEHELRSPLQAVVGFARLLQDRVPDDARHLVRQLCAGADQLVDLVNELAIEWVAGDAVAHGVGTVGDALARSTALVELLALERGVEMTVEATDRDRPVPASLGVAALAQILTNLLSNAVKFSPVGGRVTLTAGRHAGEWRFAVTDQGPGIPRGEKDHIFEPFVRRGDRPGAGLGLYVVRALTTSAGGTVDVVDGPDAIGARFTVVIPDRAT